MTNKLRDFPPAELRAHGMEAQTPETFIRGLIELFPNEVLQAAEDHRSSLTNPSKSIPEYLDSLGLQGLTGSVRSLRSLYFRLPMP